MRVSPRVCATTAGPFVVLAAALALAVPGCSTWRTSAPPGRTVLEGPSCAIAFSWRDNAPVVEAFLGAKGPYQFLVDTGAEGSLISRKCAAEAQLQTWQAATRKGHSGGTTTAIVERAWIPDVRIGEARFLNVPATVEDLSGFGIDGLLGFPVFADLVLTIDGPGEELRLNADEISSSDHAGLRLPLMDDTICPEIAGSVGGHKAIFKIDSGFDGTLGLLSDAEEILDVELASPPERLVRTILGVTAFKAGILRDRVVLGDLTMESIPVTIGVGRVLLGAGFLRDRVVGFDRRRGLLLLHEEPGRAVAP